MQWMMGHSLQRPDTWTCDIRLASLVHEPDVFNNALSWHRGWRCIRLWYTHTHYLLVGYIHYRCWQFQNKEAMKNTVQYCMPLPVFVDVFDSRWSIVAYKNDTRFMSKASFLDTIRAQLGSTPDFVAARPHDLETRKGLLWTKQTEYKTLWALPLYHLP